MAQIVELEELFPMIPNPNLFPGNGKSKSIFFTIAWAFEWVDITRQTRWTSPDKIRMQRVNQSLIVGIFTCMFFISVVN